MSFRKFLASKVFLLNIILAAFVTLLIVWLTLHLISGYTNHGESFPTPDFYGLDEETTELLADETDVRFVVFDSVYNIDFVPGTVVDQTPQAGHYIKRGRKIYLTIASYNPEYITLPKLTDVSLRQARIQIEAGGLVVGRVEYRPSEFNDLVLEQKIGGEHVDAGEMVPIGTVIDLVVGKVSGDKKTSVPDVTGFTLGDARKAILDGSLSVGAIIYDETVQNKEDSLNARVWKQLPDPLAIGGVELGTSVDIWLSLKADQ